MSPKWQPGMPSGAQMAALDAPEHAAVIDVFKEQLLLAFLRRLGGKVSVPVSEVDETSGFTLMMSVRDGTFHFELQRKQ